MLGKLSPIPTIALCAFLASCGPADAAAPQAPPSASPRPLTDNGVRAQGSPDLLKIWQAK